MYASLNSLVGLMSPNKGVDPTAAALVQMAQQLSTQPQQPAMLQAGNFAAPNPGSWGNVTSDVGSMIMNVLAMKAMQSQQQRWQQERQNLASQENIDPRQLLAMEDPEMRDLGGELLGTQLRGQQTNKVLGQRTHSVVDVPQADGTVKRFLVGGDMSYKEAPELTGLAPVVSDNAGNNIFLRPKFGSDPTATIPVAPRPENPRYFGERGEVFDPNAARAQTPDAQRVEQGQQDYTQGLRKFNQQASQYFGVPESYSAGILQRESGWDPNAVNGWDSNAKKGTPSEGVAQFIEPTFNRFYDEMSKQHGDVLQQLGPKNWRDPKQQIAVMNWALANGKDDHWTTSKAAKAAMGQGQAGVTQVGSPVTKVAPSNQDVKNAFDAKATLPELESRLEKAKQLKELLSSGKVFWGIAGKSGGPLLGPGRQNYEELMGNENYLLANSLAESMRAANLKANTGGGQISGYEQEINKTATGINPKAGNAASLKQLDNAINLMEKQLELVRQAADRGGMPINAPAPSRENPIGGTSQSRGIDLGDGFELVE